jgi:hypothetical protein
MLNVYNNKYIFLKSIKTESHMNKDAMQQLEMNEYMQMQIDVIDEAKWLEGCRTNKDPGNSFIVEWVSENADSFRKKWCS